MQRSGKIHTGTHPNYCGGKAPLHVANALISKLKREPYGKEIEPEAMYPCFMNIARDAMQTHLRQRDDEANCPQSEVCLTNIIKYPKRTASLCTEDGPLSVDKMYEGWTVAQRQAKREALTASAAQAEVTEVHHQTIGPTKQSLHCNTV
jgi:hypothetical protein